MSEAAYLEQLVKLEERIAALECASKNRNIFSIVIDFLNVKK